MCAWVIEIVVRKSYFCVERVPTSVDLSSVIFQTWVVRLMRKNTQD